MSFLESARVMRYRWQIATARFRSPEPEFGRLEEWVREGDWVLDVGANVGQYTCRLSRLVGANGRVVAVEPAPATFRVLARNTARFRHRNVTLLNLAAGAEFDVVTLTTPSGRFGLENHYLARVGDAPGGLRVVSAPLARILPDRPFRLIKLDVEGFERPALAGLEPILRRDRPTLIFERSAEAADFLRSLGYRLHEDPESPNMVGVPAG